MLVLGIPGNNSIPKPDMITQAQAIEKILRFLVEPRIGEMPDSIAQQGTHYLSFDAPSVTLTVHKDAMPTQHPDRVRDGQINEPIYYTLGIPVRTVKDMSKKVPEYQLLDPDKGGQVPISPDKLVNVLEEHLMKEPAELIKALEPEDAVALFDGDRHRAQKMLVVALTKLRTQYSAKDVAKGRVEERFAEADSIARAYVERIKSFDAPFALEIQHVVDGAVEVGREDIRKQVASTADLLRKVDRFNDEKRSL